jgi:hypothetical protein
VKDALLQAAQDMLAAVTSVNDSWGEFRTANNLYVRADILSDTDIQNFKKNHFDARITALRNAAAAAPPAAGTTPATAAAAPPAGTVT